VHDRTNATFSAGNRYTWDSPQISPFCISDIAFLDTLQGHGETNMLPTRAAPWPLSMMFWPMQFAESLFAAPESLQQSILPWTFAGVVVNEWNSTNPAMEQAIVNKASYGTQLGRISDALDSLIVQSDVKRDEAIDRFLELKVRIDDIKRNNESARFEAVLVDLRKLKSKDRPLFDECLKRVAELAVNE
jgi:hypothetical protein